MSVAGFSWTNPTQPSVTPTGTQVRVVGRSLLWNDIGYPATGMELRQLNPNTAYEFQVRLVRSVDGIVTHKSAVRRWRFVTPSPTGPVITPGDDPTDTDVTVPDADGEDCEIEVDLEENDGTGWVVIETYDEDDPEMTQNLDGTWTVTVPNTVYEDDRIYRFVWYEVCGGDRGDPHYGDEIDPPDDWTDPCTTPPALAVAPFDDAIVYVPKICNGNDITEAVSGITGTKGDAYDGLVQFLDQPDRLALRAVEQPDWDAATAGIIAYGECPQINGVTGDKSIACTVFIADDEEDVVLFECGAMVLTCVAVGGGGFRPTIITYKPGSTTTLPSSAVYPAGAIYDIVATFEYETGDTFLYVNGVQANTIGGPDSVGTINAFPIWRVGAPPGSWITDCALWDRVLSPSELPGYSPLFNAIMALDPWLYWLRDEQAGTTAFDYSGNGRHGTHEGVTLGSRLGHDGNYYATAGYTYYEDDHLQVDGNADSCVTVFGLFQRDSTDHSFASVAPEGDSGAATAAWLLHTSAVTSNAVLRADTYNTSSSTYRGRWNTPTQVIDLGTWVALCVRVYHIGTYPKITYDGVHMTGTTIGSGSGTQRVTANSGDFFNVFDTAAHVAAWAGELTDGEIDGLMAAAQEEGWF